MRTSSEDSDRNLTAFQHRRNIYFRVSRELEAGEKLRVWYSEDYIHRLQAFSGESIKQKLEAGELVLVPPANTFIPFITVPRFDQVNK